MSHWILPPPVDSHLARNLSAELNVCQPLAELLLRRGLTGFPEAYAFLNPKLKTLGDPFALPDMRRAVDRLLLAIDRKERIVLYGDYDVDGVTSLALFHRVLRALGADCHCFLPLRMDEGYGLSPDGVTRCVSTLNPQLLVALDCGTGSTAEIATLRHAGVDVLVFDHHECKESLPDCNALVNPKLGIGYHYLCSVGIVFKACHALLKTRPAPAIDLRDYLDLVALGTVADIVPLEAENRILVQKGMLQMERTRWTGLRALMEVAGVTSPVRASDIGYRLGPRLNAVGRLGTAQEALDLLLTEDPAQAKALASRLNAQNAERQGVEQRILKEAEARVAELFDPNRDAAIVLGEPGWHPGVLGIVASRLMRTHYRPTLVIGFDGDGLGKGSGRSIAGFSLVKALTVCGDFLEKFGGHEMAAGLTMKHSRFAEFREAFLGHARSTITAEDLIPRLHLNGEVALADLDFVFLDAHEQLQPFGTANPQPIFFARNVLAATPPRVLKEKHLRLDLRQNGRPHQAIYFNGASTPLPEQPWDIAFQIERNEFQGRVSVQIQIREIRKSML